jgi:hypothetical protein
MPPVMSLSKLAREFTDMTELRTAMQGFLAYYGRYEVDEPQDDKVGIVRHYVTGSSYFDYRGIVLVRHYEFDGDTLTLKAKASFDDSTRLLVWQRIGRD